MRFNQSNRSADSTLYRLRWGSDMLSVSAPRCSSLLVVAAGSGSRLPRHLNSQFPQMWPVCAAAAAATPVLVLHHLSGLGAKEQRKAKHGQSWGGLVMERASFSLGWRPPARRRTLILAWHYLSRTHSPSRSLFCPRARAHARCEMLYGWRR